MQITQILLFELIQEYSVIYLYFFIMSRILLIVIIFQIYVSIYTMFEVKKSIASMIE